jgi:hypothetical protein
MENKEFYKEFKDKLQLDDKNYLLIESPKSYLNNYNVLISGYREINYDYLYFYTQGEVWQIDLSNSIAWVSPVHKFREILKNLFKEKTFYKVQNYNEDFVNISYENPTNNKNGYAKLNLKDFGIKVFSKVDSKTIEKEIQFFEVESKKSKKFELLENLNSYISFKNEKYIEKNIIFDKKCNHGIAIDDKLTKIKNNKELNKKDFVDLVSYLILTLEEKNWTNFKDII